MKENPAHRVTAATLFVIGVAMRIGYVFQPMHYEESLTYIAFVSHPLSVGLSHYPWPNNHLLNTFFSHITSGLLGNQPWAIRLPSLVFGILLLPAVYLVARKLYNKHAALLALAMVVPCSQLIDLTTQARGFTTQAFFFLTMILSAVTVLRGRKALGWAGFAISAILCFYALPTTLYFFPPVFIWLAWSGLREAEPGDRTALVLKLAAAAAVIAVAVALLYLPVIVNDGLSSVTNNTYVASLTRAEFVDGLPGNIYDMWSGWNVMIPAPVAVLFLLGFGVALVFHRRVSKFPVNLPLIVIAWCFIMLNVQQVLPFARNWLPLLPLYFICASAGLVYAARYAAERLFRHGRSAPWVSAPVACALLVVLTLILSSLTIAGRTAYQKDEFGKYTNNTTRDAETITLFLKDKLQEGDVVYSDVDYLLVPLQYYFMKHGVPLDHLVMRVPDVTTFPVNGSPEEKRAAWYPLGLRPGGPGSIQRAFFIVAGKEGHTLEASFEFATTTEGGFTPGDFQVPSSPILDTGFTQLLVSYRNTNTASGQ